MNASRVTPGNFTPAFPRNRTWKSPLIRLFLFHHKCIKTSRDNQSLRLVVILSHNTESSPYLRIVTHYETEQANPFVTPGFPGYLHSYELVRHQNLSPSLTACLSKVGYKTILTSLVSYKSPDYVPDTFTPYVMQTLIRLHSALLFSIQAFHGYNRDYPFLTSLKP